MFKFSNSRLISAVIFWLNLAFGAVVIVTGLIALWLIISPLVMRGSAHEISAAVPVMVGDRTLHPIIPVEAPLARDTAYTLSVVDARGELRFLTTSWELQFYSYASYLIAGLIILSILYLIRDVVRNVAEGNPFKQKSAINIRRIGGLLALSGIVAPVVEYVCARMLLNQLQPTTPSLSPPFTFELDIILAGLLIVIISQVWMYGAELEYEQSLTV